MKTFEPNKTISELGIDTTRKFISMDGWNKGDILTLIEDDGSIYPYFKNQHGIEGHTFLENLAYYEEMKEGDYVYVSDTSEEDAIYKKEKRILLRKCTDGYVTIVGGYEEKYLKGEAFETFIWKYAVPVPALKTITLEVTEEQEEQINNILKK